MVWCRAEWIIWRPRLSTTSKMIQMMNRCWEAEGQYHKSEETLAALRRAVDADLVSTHMLPHMLPHTCYLTHANCTVPDACLCLDNNVMTKAEYMIGVMMIVKNMMVKTTIMMTTTNDDIHKKSNIGSVNSHVCPAHVSSLHTGFFHVQMP